MLLGQGQIESRFTCVLTREARTHPHPIIPNFNKHHQHRFGREMEDGPGTLVSQEWTDDDIVIHLRLRNLGKMKLKQLVHYPQVGDYVCPGE
jgi:hypothetical protein